MKFDDQIKIASSFLDDNLIYSMRTFLNELTIELESGKGNYMTHYFMEFRIA